MDCAAVLQHLPLDLTQRLAALDAAVFSSRPLPDVLELVLDTALASLEARYGSLRWVNRRERTLELKALRNSDGVAELDAPPTHLCLDGTSILAEVVKTRRPLCIPDLNADQWCQRYVPLNLHMPMRSELAVPLFASDGKTVVGTLNVEHPAPDVFSQVHEDCLQALAWRAYLVVQRTRLTEALQKVSQAVHMTNHEALLQYTVEALAEILDIPVCSIWLSEPETDELLLKEAIGRPRPQQGLQDTRLSMQSVHGEVMKTRTPRYVRNVQNYQGFIAQELAAQQHWGSALFVPICDAEGQSFGVISVYSKEEERDFSPQDRGLALAFAQQVAISLRQATLLANHQRLTAQLRVINSILTASVEASDSNAFLHHTAREIRDAFGYWVDLCLLQQQHLFFKVTAPYEGPVQPHNRILEVGQGITGMVAKTGIACVVPDVTQVGNYICTSEKTRSEIALPLGNPVIGVLNIESRETPLSHADLKFFEPIAAHITLALANARQRQEHTVLRHITTVVSQAQDLQHIFANTAAAARQVLEAQACVLSLTEPPHTAPLRLAWQEGCPDERVAREHTLAVAQTLAGKVLQNGTPLVVLKAEEHADTRGLVTATGPVQSLLGVPIQNGHGRLGVLQIWTTRRRRFTAYEVGLLDVIGSSLGWALERARAADQYRRLYEDARDAMFTVNLDRTIRAANRRATELLGYPPQELVGRELMMFVTTPEEAEKARGRFESLIQDETAEVPLMEFAIQPRYGPPFFVESNLTPMRDYQGHLTAVHVIWRDITARRRATEAQQRQRVAATTLTYLDQLSNLLLVHKVPDVLLPIHAIAEHFNGLFRVPTGKTAAMLETLRRLDLQAARLVDLCHRLGRPWPKRLDEVSLSWCIQDVLDHLAGREFYDVELQLPDLPTVRADTATLCHVLGVLVQNALDAMPDGGRLFIRGSPLSDRRMVELEVGDTGHGIKPEHVARLFTPGGTTKDDAGGSGFGLWLSRLYLERLGGEIDLIKTSPQGTTFTLRLPVALTDWQAPPKVLIVDNESLWHPQLSWQFKEQEWEVYEVTSAAAARDLLDQHHFAAFVVDVCLTDSNNRDGLAVVEQLRHRDVSTPGLITSVFETALADAHARYDGQKALWIAQKGTPQWEAALDTLATRRHAPAEPLEGARSYAPPPAPQALPLPQEARWAAPAHRDMPQTAAADEGRLGSADEARGQRGTLLIVENDQVWREDVAALCESVGFTVVQAGDANEAALGLEQRSSPPILAIVDLHLPTSASQESYEGLSLLTDLRDRGIYALVVTSYLPDRVEDLKKRPEVLNGLDKWQFRTSESKPVFLAHVRRAVASAEAARRAEGQLPEQQARLDTLRLIPPHES